MLALMLRDISFTSKVIKYILPEHLYSEAHRWVFNEIKKRYEENGTVPTFVIFEDRMRLVDAARRRLFRAFAQRICDIVPEDTEYIKKALGEFAKQSQFVELFSEGMTLYNSGKRVESYEYVRRMINTLHSVTFDDDEIVKFGDFDALRRNFVAMKAMTTDHIPTGIKPIDSILRGGLSKLEGELGVILAEPKKGKSVSLVHMGAMALMLRSAKVAHFVLEGSTETTVIRYLSRLTGIPATRLASDDLSEEEDALVAQVGRKYMNRLDLIPMNKHWDYTTGDIESKLIELDQQGRSPDMLVIDYADLLSPRTKTREERINQREVYRDLKRMAVNKKKAIWTAAQATRPKDDPHKEKTIRGDSVSESFEKVRIADFLCSLNQTPHEKKLGILRLHADIYRNAACDQTVYLITDLERMIFHSSRFGCIEMGDIPAWMSKKRR